MSVFKHSPCAWKIRHTGYTGAFQKTKQCLDVVTKIFNELAVNAEKKHVRHYVMKQFAGKTWINLEINIHSGTCLNEHIEILSVW